MSIRRGLPLASAAFVVLGLEMATGMVTGSLGMLIRTGRDLLTGDPVGVYVPAYVLGILLTTAGAGGLVVSAWTRWSGGKVARGKTCLRCGTQTIRLRRRKRHKLLGRIRDETLHRRRCSECGWTGLTRVD